MKIKLSLPLLLLASPVFADNYRSFSVLSYDETKYSGSYETINDNSEVSVTTFPSQYSTHLASQYYFADQKSRGTLDEFGYLDTDSSISAGLGHSNFSDSAFIGGEVFLGDFIIGAGASYSESDYFFSNQYSDSFSGHLGYLFNDNLIVKIDTFNAKGQKSQVDISAEYEHSLGGDNYLGFSATVDDELETGTVSSSYFSAVGGGQFIRASLYYHYSDVDCCSSYDSAVASAAFYFTPGFSVMANLIEGGAYGLGSRYYFNDNWALAFYFNDDNDQPIGSKTYIASLSAQF